MGARFRTDCRFQLMMIIHRQTPLFFLCPEKFKMKKNPFVLVEAEDLSNPTSPETQESANSIIDLTSVVSANCEEPCDSFIDDTFEVRNEGLEPSPVPVMERG